MIFRRVLALSLFLPLIFVDMILILLFPLFFVLLGDEMAESLISEPFNVWCDLL